MGPRARNSARAVCTRRTAACMRRKHPACPARRARPPTERGAKPANSPQSKVNGERSGLRGRTGAGSERHARAPASASSARSGVVAEGVARGAMGERVRGAAGARLGTCDHPATIQTKMIGKCKKSGEMPSSASLFDEVGEGGLQVVLAVHSSPAHPLERRRLHGVQVRHRGASRARLAQANHCQLVCVCCDSDGLTPPQ